MCAPGCLDAQGAPGAPATATAAPRCACAWGSCNMAREACVAASPGHGGQAFSCRLQGACCELHNAFTCPWSAGIRLYSPAGLQTRPMMEKVRGALFSMLLAGTPGRCAFPADSRWLDLYAGTVCSPPSRTLNASVATGQPPAGSMHTMPRFGASPEYSPGEPSAEVSAGARHTSKTLHANNSIDGLFAIARRRSEYTAMIQSYAGILASQRNAWPAPVMSVDATHAPPPRGAGT